MTIYDEMVAARVPLDSHESDLYALDCPASRAILRRFPTHKANAQRFHHAVTGAAWIDVPFAFDPFWNNKARRAGGK